MALASIVLGVTVALGGARLMATTAAAEPVWFNRDVRPILADNCYACHRPDSGQRKAELRFDTRAGLISAEESGLIMSGKPEVSELVTRITSADRDQVMPHPASGKSLDRRQIAMLTRWIEEGAQWQPHWAYLPPVRPRLPAVAGLPNLLGPVDRFLLAKQRRAGVHPAAEADSVTLLRRLTLDLTGLPPAPGEVEVFLADLAANAHEDVAYENAVDRLLASPHYGERMALNWLDRVRYADSNGYHKDLHRDVWLFRDYVIAAFNDNKPFDEFAIEQLAGDLLPETKYDEFEQKIASGFNRMNQTSSEGGVQAEEYLVKYAADRVRNTSAIFLGATMGCAQCHDHKFDPFTTQDFYRFAAFFADIQEQGNGKPEQVAMPARDQVTQWKRIDAEIDRLQVMQEQAASGPLPEPSVAETLDGRIAQLKHQRQQFADPEYWHETIITQPGEPRPTRVLPRGNWMDDSGPIVAPAIPEFLGKLDVGQQRATRLDLARWMVSRDNPLTARVFVNRLWKLFFGSGICEPLDDLGCQGEPPTHPDLLDWLAVEFMESGWDVKHMVRLLVTSAAYRRSSSSATSGGHAPDRALFARQASYRLDAELVRDNALAISGLLSRKIGGPSVKPYQPSNYWQRLYEQGEYIQDHGEALYRRGLYTYWRRSYWHPSLLAFDAPSREECVATRPRSNTPQQALVLLNDPTYVEAARVFAQRILSEGGPSSDERFAWAFRRAVSRLPSESETAVLTDVYSNACQKYRADRPAAEKLVRVGEWPVPEDINQVELAAWTSVARVILNLHETITRN